MRNSTSFGFRNQEPLLVFDALKRSLFLKRRAFRLTLTPDNRYRNVKRYGIADRQPNDDFDSVFSRPRPATGVSVSSKSPLET